MFIYSDENEEVGAIRAAAHEDINMLQEASGGSNNAPRY